MALTDIASQKTPGRPVEITFAAETGLPSANQEVLLFGHAATGTTGTNTVINIDNSADPTLGKAEAETKFGVGSELAKMVVAAIKANAGQPNFPTLKCVPLDLADTGFGTSDAALTAAAKVKAEYLVSPYDGAIDALPANNPLALKLKSTALAMSGPQRVDNNQFGSFGVVFNRAVTDPSLLPKYDTQFLIPVWLRDTATGGDAPAYSVAEMAAAAAAVMAANQVPFNPLDDITVQNVVTPKKISDYVSRGAGLDSEAALATGWTPLYEKPNGEVAFVRTVTARLSPDGTGAPLVTAYYDQQDFNVLYLWRKTLFTRLSQPDMKRRKASTTAAQDIKSEVIRLASAFEDQNMFQAVSKLASKFKVERNLSDRHRFDVFTPVNVIPGLHVIATNVQAGTEFDILTI